MNELYPKLTRPLPAMPKPPVAAKTPASHQAERDALRAEIRETTERLERVLACLNRLVARAVQESR